jgi:hypothetical protein
MRSVLFCDITRRRVVTVYQRFGTMDRSHLQGSRVQEEKKASNCNIDSISEGVHGVVISKCDDSQ